MSGQKIILIGGGGHCKSVIDAIEAGGIYSIKGILDVPRNLGKPLLGYSITGTDEDIENLAAKGYCFVITMGQIKNSGLRQRTYERLKACNAAMATIIAPTAYISKHASIGEGTVVLHHVTVNAGASIGCNNIINTGSNIEHDVHTGDHCHIATHAVLNGDCHVDNGVFVGSNSVLAQGVTIVADVVIGAGAVIYKNIEEPGVYAGNPVKKYPDAANNYHSRSRCEPQRKLENAFRLVDAASEAGVDYVKFQTFKAEHLVAKSAKKAEYQISNTGNATESQLQMLKKLELSHEDHEQLIAYCKQKNIHFFSTAFDLESLEYLAELGLEFVKIPSGEITNLPYLRKAAKLFKKVIVSTGMATMSEIRDAVATFTSEGVAAANITILHCNTEYPTPMKDVNLKAMLHIQQEMGTAIGYSDHTLGIEVPIAAVALGATVIEKHFTLDQDMEGPDHKASLEPEALKAMVEAIRNVEAALSGSGYKEPSASEMKNTHIARKSIVAKTDIKKGERFSEENITTKRPGTGISPMRWDEVIGQVAEQDYNSDDLIVLKA